MLRSGSVSLPGAWSGRFSYIPHFGSGDCRCGGHLYIENDKDRLRAGVVEVVAWVGLACRTFP